jgi:hypothetical protein
MIPFPIKHQNNQNLHLSRNLQFIMGLNPIFRQRSMFQSQKNMVVIYTAGAKDVGIRIRHHRSSGFHIGLITRFV